VDVDVAVLDLKMPGMSGIEVLREARRKGSLAEVIVLTGHGSIGNVVEAMKLGAFDYLTKPCRLAELELLVSRAAARKRGEPAPSETGAAPAGRGRRRNEPEIVTASPALERVLRIIDKAAPTDATVLIEGESGTGKELLARRLHARSKVGGPLVVVNCGALQDTLLLSELFGHEKGSFTGADRVKLGLLEKAQGGTAFLDEIGELSSEAQVRLLRFLQFGELRRVGGTRTISVKVRVVAATNRILRDEATEGRFREDLFYRLHTIHISVPPLRERPEDIPLLVERCLTRFEGGRRMAADALSLLVGSCWPGNVRELENIVCRLAILSDGQTITREDVWEYFEGLHLEGAAITSARIQSLREMERQAVAAALVRNKGDKVTSAKELGIALKTLYNKIKAYNIHV